jgi:hypothetical protein
VEITLDALCREAESGLCDSDMGGDFSDSPVSGNDEIS